MLTSWLTFTAFLAIPACPGRGATGRGTLTVGPTCWVKGHPEVELTLNCGDGRDLGVVQYWHTPFGDLQTPGVHSKLDPVFMRQDGSLVVPNTSFLHSGLYYCLLQHTEGTTLWPYELRVCQNHQEHGEHEQSRGCGAFRFRRDAGSEEEESQAGVSGEQFAGAVAASVLLTFVLGFSAGALSRTHVLRCLGAVSAKLQSPKRRRRCQTDTPDCDLEVSMTTLPPMYENQVSENDSATNPSPPAKPQRSFRQKREEEEQPETTAYLEGCDYMKKKEKTEEKEEARTCAEERNKDDEEAIEEEAEERKFGRLYLIGEDGESQSETDEEEKMEDLVQEKEEEVAEEERSEEKDGEREISRDSEDSSTETEDETSGNDQVTNGAPSASAPRPARRVIRLYHYDEDGRRYGHLPDPALEAPLPAPRLKQRTVSLSRLSAIMAAASAGPLGERETRREESEEEARVPVDT